MARKRINLRLKSGEEWPEDDWESLGENWDINYRSLDPGEPVPKRADIYPVSNGSTDTSMLPYRMIVEPTSQQYGLELANSTTKKVT